MRRSILVLVIVCVMAGANIASATIIRAINMDFVTIGNAGNPGDTRTEANPSGCGAVGYDYSIGKYEITNAQWNTFVSAAGAPTGNPSDAYDENAYYTDSQQPTNCVSWYETLQFCNYLTSGDKSKGVYQFSGNNANPDDFLGIDRDSAVSAYGTVYVIPTEDEWYKAAYYKPDGSGYSLFANGTDTAPSTSEACYAQSYPYSGPLNISSGTEEQNGTFDMMGNVWEWNETMIDGSGRGVRGGSYSSGYVNQLSSSYRDYYHNLVAENVGIGFRVASVPEPCSLVLLSLGGLALMWKRRAK